MIWKRTLGRIFATAVVLGILYLPARRVVLDEGWIPAGRFRSTKGSVIVLYDNGRYRANGQEGRYTIQYYPEAPWISLLKLDTGQVLHARYEDRSFRVEDIPFLADARQRYLPD